MERGPRVVLMMSETACARAWGSSGRGDTLFAHHRSVEGTTAIPATS